jgi:hypothetical protein
MVVTINNIRKKYEKSSIGILIIRIFRIASELYSTIGREVSIPFTIRNGISETK